MLFPKNRNTTLLYMFLDFEAGVIKRVIPLLDRILIQRAEALTQSKGGIVIPESAQSKVSQGTVVAVGSGGRNKNGDLIPISLNVGDKVLLPEFGGTKVNLDDGKEYHLFRESDILAKLEQ
ncbi:10 kDa heat shock protein, mitochondrial-like isoform X1 [Sitodiplosis mosellana]|uniref:10 kDa heat shock protein, mitochondrial-like isoform X1 n=1 Tax=Sitodiplosis mosellana TaxID=263140 RepID=UPI0024446A0E|nr:10 kDa heat shock protein, mitochondrial-like isoform X1 [Sitodiplosis mosellana]